MTERVGGSSASLFDGLQNFGECFGARFRPEIPFAVDANADCVGLHVAFSEHEHGVNLLLLGALNFAVDLVDAFIDFGADFVNAQLVQNRSRMPSIIRLCFLSWGPGSSPRRSTQLAWISDEPG